MDLEIFTEMIVKAFNASLEADKMQFQSIIDLTNKVNSCNCSGQNPLLAIVGIIIAVVALIVSIYCIREKGCNE